MDRNQLVQLIQENIMTTGEVLEELKISRAALSNLKNKGILVPIKEGVYLKEDVLNRRKQQLKGQVKYVEGNTFLQMLQKTDPEIKEFRKIRGQTIDEVMAQFRALEAEGWELFHEPQYFTSDKNNFFFAIAIKK
ncbi:type IV toxin-antitoxin system AbiEi family antitoxin domain-containing protein [Carboxydocella sp. ULO1]|uniref:type IV toxin-antitoxin system AbiEi family antitoxin domain-containing protein n=1 Tax=Carboxydocella sp. ULO1 TaxID=1926599 RepID=UPI0009AF1608|nr:type IV toxin-antitoxin system AbiEi family antitoxin domain-containing protein [Carboxydocella sp. ULO1]GAW28852.1 hypothetical protein ULO1_14220 [Carboxydocella sp. ULO1]